jgi:predicted membrane protein
LDFSGDFKHRAYVNIDVGLGSMTILIPKDVGVQIKSESSFLSSVDIDEDDFEEIEDDLYESDNFGQAERELVFDIEVGLGSVEIEYVNR